MTECKIEDVQIDTYRPVTKVDYKYYNHATMTRIVHKPTGLRIVVAGTNDLSRRKELALEKLKKSVNEHYSELTGASI